MKKCFIVFICAFITVVIGVTLTQTQRRNPSAHASNARAAVDRETVVPRFDNNMVIAGDSFTADFSLGKAITNYDYVNDGVEVISLAVPSRNGKSIRAVLSAAMPELGVFGITIDTTDGCFYQSNVYTYTAAGFTFISGASADDAWTKSMVYRLENTLSTIIELENEYAVFSRRSIIETPGTAPTRGTALSGHVEWRPRNNVAYLPCQRIKVELYYVATGILGINVKLDETYTDDAGNYTFDNYSVWSQILASYGLINILHPEYMVRVYPESETFKVAKDWIGVNLLDEINKWSLGLFPDFLAYYIESSTHVWIWQSAGSFGDISIPYNDDPNSPKYSNRNNAFYISQALVMGQRFVQDVRNYNINKFATVLYPFNDNTPFCWDVFMGIGRSHFDDWQGVLHEYGHFIQGCVGTNNISILDYALYGPEHGNGEDDHIYEKGNKNYGIKLGWTEAWAEAFSMVVIDYYATGYYLSGQVLGAGGAEILKARIDSWHDYNTYNPIADSGEGQEDAITAFLWRLYKQIIGQNGFWNTTTISGTYTLTDYINTLNAQYAQQRSQIGVLMGALKIAPQILTSTYTPSVSTPPTITWIVNGSQFNPNNQFRIAFYNDDGIQKYETGNVSFVLTPATSPNQNRRDLDTASYTLTQQEFNSALASFSSGETIHIAVKGYRTGSPVTGPYWSATIPNIPETLPISSLVFSPINNGNEYSVTNILDKQFAGRVKIPSTYNGKPVTTIGNWAFYYCNVLTSVTLPNTLQTIGKASFAYCSGLTSITIPNSVTSIGEGAFLGNSNVTSLTFEPNSKLSEIGSQAFAGCSGLTGVTTPNSVWKIGDGAFAGCSGLTSMTLLRVVNIGFGAFAGCNSLTSITLPFVGKETGNATDAYFGYIFGAPFNIQVYNSGQSAYIPASLKTVVITGGGTIDNYAFSGCNNLTSIVLPSDVISIGAYAFYCCSNLTNFTIPGNVTGIGNGAFYCCSSLTNVYIGSNSQLTSIGTYTFFGCGGLTGITIPGGVTSVGSDAFWGCTALSVTWYYNPTLATSNFSQYIKSVVIPSGVTRISDNAFAGFSGLTEINIPSSVTYIGLGAFYGFTSLSVTWDYNPALMANEFSQYLKSAIIPSNVTSIGSNAFAGCGGLTEINIPNSVTSIGNYAFYGCSGLTEINIPNSVASIGTKAFSNCSGLTSITIPSSVTSIGSGAFYGCNGLTSITLPRMYSHFGYIFGASNPSVQSSYIPSSLENVTIEGGSVGYFAFHGCDGLKYITLGNDVTYIDWVAFPGCTSLQSLTIPFVGNTLNGNTNTHFGYIFGASNAANQNSCIPSSLTSVTVTGGRIDDYAFRSCDDITVTLTSGVTSIGYGAFNDSKFTGVIPNTVTSIDERAFYGCNDLTNLSVASGNPVYKSDGNCIIRKSDNVLITGLNYSTIPNYVTSIGNYAFYNGSGSGSLTIPSSVKNIGEGAFYGCRSLTNIAFAPNSQLTYIGYSAFSNCWYLSNITIPGSVTDIGIFAFNECRSLANITLTAGLKNIGDFAFYGNIANSIIVPDTVESIGRSALSGNNLTHITLPFADNNFSLSYIGGGNVKTVIVTSGNIGDYAFSYCSNLTSITLPDNATSIGYAFYGCSSLTSIVIPSSVESIAFGAFENTGIWNNTPNNSMVYADKWAVGYKGTISGNVTLRPNTEYIGECVFADCYDLVSVVMPNGLIGIGACAFSCSGLTSIMIPNSVMSIGEGAFFGCGLMSITIPDNVTNIGYGAFAYCGGLASISVASGNPVYKSDGNCIIRKSDNALILGCNNSVIPNYITSIGDYAFGGCYDLTNITIPYGVTSIGDYAFAECYGLTDIEIPDSVTHIGEGAFSCSGLISITFALPSNLTEIWWCTFAGCYDLTSVIIPDGVTDIWNWAFADCYSLQSVIIPISVTGIGEGAFAGCWDLTAVYYCGDVSDWNGVNIGEWAFEALAEVYYYSETPVYDGQHWHYDAYETPVVW